MKITKIVSSVITVVLMLLSVFISFFILNMVYPPEFSLFSLNPSNEIIKEYFNNIENHERIGVFGIVLIDVLMGVVAFVLIKLMREIYKPYAIKGKVIFFSAMITVLFLYIFSKISNLGIIKEINYFLETYFWIG